MIVENMQVIRRILEIDGVCNELEWFNTDEVGQHAMTLPSLRHAGDLFYPQDVDELVRSLIWQYYASQLLCTKSDATWLTGPKRIRVEIHAP